MENHKYIQTTRAEARLIMSRPTACLTCQRGTCIAESSAAGAIREAAIREVAAREAAAREAIIRQVAAIREAAARATHVNSCGSRQQHIPALSRSIPFEPNQKQMILERLSATKAKQISKEKLEKMYPGVKVASFRSMFKPAKPESIHVPASLWPTCMAGQEPKGKARASG